MPCGCTPACGCGSAAACAGSLCVGSAISTAHIAALGSMMATRAAYLGGLHPDSSTEANEELARQELRSKRQIEMAQLERRLAHIESLRPLALVRSARRLERERSKMQGRIQRLAHELSILES